MKSKISTIISAIIFSVFTTNSYSQIDGHHCGFDHAREQLLKEDPSYLNDEQRLNTYLLKKKLYRKKNGTPVSKKSAAPKYIIPVVFHILHDGGESNISEEQVLSAIDRLNECYQGKNSELASVQSEFTSLVTTMDIEFRLAKRAPNGQCFNGITRTKSSETSSGSESSQLNAVKNGNDVYQGEWRSDEYLNIFSVTSLASEGAAAYAYYPSTSGMSRGVWSQHIYIGNTGTSNQYRSGTIVHELGHWFSLAHPWGGKNLVGDNNPVPSDCGVEDDGVDDTPSTIGNKSCNVNANTCDSDNSYWGYDKIDNVENFMEYSYCFKMFTIGQGQRMEDALDDMSSPRFNIWQPTNLTETGVNLPDAICKADFSTNRTTVCMGETIIFNDESYSNPTGWTWTFDGGTVIGSINDQNPSVVYNAPGTYSVSLTSTDGIDNVTTTKNDYITVISNPGSTSPIQEGFENTSNLPNNFWHISQEHESDYKIINDASNGGNFSLKISNSSLKDGNVYELTSSTIDLSESLSPVIKFDRAFAKRNNLNTDFMQVFASNNCGESFTPIKYITTSGLTTRDPVSGLFLPEEEDWEQMTITLPLDYYVSNFIVKFVFTSGGGNHFYIDNINIGDEDSFVSVNEFVMDGNKYQLSPNPAQSEINLTLDLNIKSAVKLDVFDVLGKKIISFDLGVLTKGINSKKLALSDIEAGTYFFNISINDVPVSTERIIIQ